MHSATLYKLLSQARSGKLKSSARSGFTLVELMIVVVIIGILAAVGIPQYLGVRNRAEAKTVVGELMGSAKECASLQVEGETGQTITDPAGNSLTCDGSAAQTLTSRTPKLSATVTGVKCAGGTVDVADATAVTAEVARDGSITCN